MDAKPPMKNKYVILANRFIDGKWALAVAVVLAAAAVGCNKSSEPPAAGGGTAGASAPAGDTIKIGEFASLTGKEASFGQMSHNGTELAISDLNAQGGALGKKLQLLTEDD